MGRGALVGEDYTMSALATVEVTIGGKTEFWTSSPTPETLKIGFTHDPEGETGLGATNDGESFSGNCEATGGDDWESLIKTDGPYNQVWWYLKEPWETDYGEPEDIDQGDGVERKATWDYTFPNGDGDRETEGAFYEITAYVYRSDNSVYWESYRIWVNDKRGHD